MKVMTAMYTIKRGGAYDRFIMMIEAFLDRHCEVHCLSLTPIRIDHSSFHNHKMYFPFKKVDGLIARIVVLSFFPLWALWLGWRNRIDLIIAFGPLYAFILGFSKWLLRKPMVTLIRLSSSLVLTMRHISRNIFRVDKVIEYLGLFWSDRIITNYTITHEDIIKRIGKSKYIEVELLYNNIPPISISKPGEVSQTRTKYEISEEAKIIVIAGIINRRKNMEILIRCLLKIGTINLYLIIVGDSLTKADFRYRDTLQELAIKMGVEKKVIFTGWLEKEELWKIYFASDLFVLSSLNEGMPNAMLEALGSDLPCMGSNIPGIRDILQYDELLFDPLDEEALIQKIRHLFSDHQHLQKIKGLCEDRKKIFIFDWKEKVFQIVTKAIQSPMVN